MIRYIDAGDAERQKYRRMVTGYSDYYKNMLGRNKELQLMSCYPRILEFMYYSFHQEYHPRVDENHRNDE